MKSKPPVGPRMDKGRKKNGVNLPLTTVTWPADVALALNYAGADMVALMRFDRTLAMTVAGARDPALAQLRLAWWRTQFAAPVAGSEGYDAIVRFGSGLTPIVDGWEHLLAPLPLEAASLRAYGTGRGGGLFALLGGRAEAGAGWALADFARHCSDAATRRCARTLADDALTGSLAGPKPLRILARLARSATITRWTLLRAALG